MGLLATTATVNSGAYARALAEAAPDAELHAVAAPDLAPLIQEGGEVDERVIAAVEEACGPLIEADVDTVILGCTHYPLVRPALQRRAGTRGRRWCPRARRSPRRSRAACARGAWRARTSTAAATIASWPPATPTSSAGWELRFLQLPIGEVRHVDVSPASPRKAAA